MPNKSDNAPEELSLEIRQAVLQQELETHLALRYRLEVRGRVNRKIGADENTIKAILGDLERVEAAIDTLRDEIKALKE